MISWQHPTAFAALVLVPALAGFLVWAWRRRAQALDAFVASGLLPVVAPEVDPRRRTRRAALRTTAIGLLVLALAGPMWGFRWEQVHREGIDLIVALDTSRSMLATDVKPNRLTRAKLGIQDLLAETQGDRVGLIAFAGTAFVQCPLTLDHGAFLQALEASDVGIIPRGGTDLASAIDAALGAFEGRQGNHQALVLITDGESLEGDWKAAVARAKERGLRIYTVGIGTTEGELVPGDGGTFFKDRRGQAVTSRLDETTLQQIAVDTGGVYLHAAGTSMGLTELYRDHIATLEKRDLESTLERRWEPRFQIPLALALLLLLVEPFIDERRQTVRERRRWRFRGAAAAVVLAMLSIGWFDPHARGREGNALYADGKYKEAATEYNQGLLDDPDSVPLHYNLGDAQYEAKEYDAAMAAFGQVPADPNDPALGARVAYNVGNIKFRQGAAVEGAEPQKAIALWTEALVAYRRALGASPDDQDAKFNYELVLAKIEALKKKLEEQQKQQEKNKDQQQKDDQKKDDEQQKQEQKDEQQKNDEQQKKDEQQQEQQQQGEKPPEDQQQQQQPQPQEGEKPPEQQPEQQQQQAGGEPKEQQQPEAGEQTAGEGGEGEMTKDEAAALLDSQRDQEVQPGEVVRRLQGAGVAEPSKDW
ncbi:MAG TPA: VWA domain-containing protein [Candidatus Binatia bacterium]|jgi:Ca-activated chloride channel family protein|nr:VWA domain-containing protein [Candidatus Binatia bacterium]